MTEHWLPVVGFEGQYEVSDHGQVRSLPRTVPYGTSGATMGVPGKVLAPFLEKQVGNKLPHWLIDVGGRKNKRKSKVHILVLEAFIGPRPAGMVARHLDGDPNNNHASNLAWGSYSENMHDMVKHGRHAGVNKTHCSKGHPLDGRWGNGKRYCKTCHSTGIRDYKSRKRSGGLINPPGRPRKVRDS